MTSSSDSEVQWSTWQPEPLTEGTASQSTPQEQNTRLTEEAASQTDHAQAIEQACQAAKEKGFQAGFEQGFSDGKQKAEEQVQAQAVAMLSEQKQQLSGILETFSKLQAKATETLEQSLMQFSVAVGEQLASHRLSMDHQVVQELFHEALLQEPALSGNPRAFMHPEDTEAITAIFQKELEAAGWELVADDTISRGGFRVEASSGCFDAQVETRRERLEALIDKHQAALFITS